MEMNVEKMAIKVTEKVLDDLLYKGKTLREWIDLIIEFEKEYEILPMGKYPASISGCNMEEDVKQVEKSCNNCANYNSCDPSKCFNLIRGTRLNWKQKEDTRFICKTCKRKEGCIYYEFLKKNVEENPKNDMKCAFYIKE